MAELSVTIGMITALFRLAIALQTVALLAQQLGDLHVTDRMLASGQPCGQRSCTFANPAQGGLGIAARFRFNQIVQRAEQAGIMGDYFLASTPRPADASGRRCRSRGDFPEALGDSFARQTTGATDLRDAAMTQDLGFTGGHEPTRTFVQERPQGSEFSLKLGERIHIPESYARPPSICYLYLFTAPNRYF